ncbi:hypothetical protein C2S52_017881 [Perilla frutescens var. hirtella]|nr:hypothetical protein C2S52_017881 [Perilla frutescens var. hirtella]
MRGGSRGFGRSMFGDHDTFTSFGDGRPMSSEDDEDFQRDIRCQWEDVAI